MYETHVTVVGNVATAIAQHRLADGTVVANFRVGSTQRRYDRASGGWVDGDSLYVDVTCWRSLAENAVASLVKGDPVVVTGRLYTRTYEHEGQRRTAVTLEAQSVAADLAWCTAVLTRTRRRTAAASTASDAPADDQPEPVGAAPLSAAPDGGEEPADGGARLVGAAPGNEG
jgi:single-strand DNA-binding protein